MNWSIVGNHEIYIFPRALTIWLTLSFPGVRRTLNPTRRHLRSLSEHNKLSLLCCLLKHSFELTMPCENDCPALRRASRCQKTQVSAAAIGLWALSYYCSALEIAPLLKLQAFFFFWFEQNSVSLPQQSRGCVREMDCSIY